MMTNPKVTVLMSVHNGQKYLREAIESILNQTYLDFEFLIIDDGSTDGSSDIIRSYQDGRIQLVRSVENLGLTRSLNKGLKLARGEYIARMDGDDVSLPSRLEKQVGYLDEYKNVGLVSNLFVEIDEMGEEIGLKSLPTENDEIKESLLRVNCFCHTSSMFRQKCIEAVGPYREEFKMAQDYDLWLRIAEEFDVANIEEPLCKVRIVNGSISNAKISQQKYHARMAYWSGIQRQVFGEDELGYKPAGEHFRLLRDEVSGRYFRRKRAISEKYLACARYAFAIGRWDRRTALRYILKSLVNNPFNFTAWRYIVFRGFRKNKEPFNHPADECLSDIYGYEQ